MENAVLYILIATAVVVLILNIAATYVVFNTYFEVKKRRLYQTLFVWLLPFVGALMAIYLNRQDYFEQKRQRQIGNHTGISNSDAISHAIAANHRGGR
ncbi:MAG: hypothetical protein KAJ92_01050 [Gammaproteobacteria bacterium]|nr:hypothetical protein [Gammaproteobacteria bacterium]